MLFNAYFSDSVKKKMEEDFKQLRSGNRTAWEYELEFFHIINCISFMVGDDKRKADCFELGLRPKIYKMVQSPKLQSFAEVLDRAFWVEQGLANAWAEWEALDKGKEKK